MKFDWYEATIEEPPIDVSLALLDAYPGAYFRDACPLKGYGVGADLMFEGFPALHLSHGGHNAHPHVRATGDGAERGAEAVRSRFDHLVSRVDVCEDLEAPGWFDQAFPTLKQISRECRVKMLRYGDWDSEHPSRTIYLGAAGSAVRVRTYEKGRELQEKYGLDSGFSSDWTRVEVQVRPAKREYKRVVADLEPCDIFGCSSFSRLASKRLLGLDAPRIVAGTKYRVEDFDRQFYYMLKQYGKLFNASKNHLGSWEAVGAHIGQQLETKRY